MNENNDPYTIISNIYAEAINIQPHKPTICITIYSNLFNTHILSVSLECQIQFRFTKYCLNMVFYLPPYVCNCV